MSTACVSPQEIYESISRGARVDLVDVRSPREFENVHATMARLVPLDTLDPKAFAATADASTIAVICKSGIRAKDAARRMVAAGAKNVVVVDGGTQAWATPDCPSCMERSPSAWTGRRALLPARWRSSVDCSDSSSARLGAACGGGRRRAGDGRHHGLLPAGNACGEDAVELRQGMRPAHLLREVAAASTLQSPRPARTRIEVDACQGRRRRRHSPRKDELP